MNDQLPATVTAPESSHITTVYAEVCRSHQALDDFRMKLLGFLPIASIAGLVALDRMAGGAATVNEREIIAFVGLFAAFFTLALFVYEISGILMCNDLRQAGVELEAAMRLQGQFSICNESRKLPCYIGPRRRALARWFNGKIAACIIYSFVLAAWLFVGLRYGFDVRLHTCALCAAGVAAALAVGTYVLLQLVVTPQSHATEAVKTEVSVVSL
jgi:hypothetical protein